MIDYLEDIKKIISKEFGIPEENIEDESLLENDLSITGLDLEDLITTIENKYDIKIPQEQISSFKKVSDLVSYLYENVESPEPL